jgi:predicted histone-like DNA-binding protein
MAVRKIAFPVVYQQNQNDQSSAYGKYYPKPYKPDTLSLRGLIERVAMDQSVYSRDIVEGVIQRLTKVMVELLQGGQPVKWDGLGTFTPTIESVKGGATEAQLKAGVDVRDVINGVHIRFIPENEKGEEITSRKFKDLVVFTVMGIAERVSAGLTSGGKQKYATNVIDLENWKNSGTSPSPSGGESQGGSQSGNGGSQSGNGGSQNQPTTYALSISTSGSGSASVTNDGNAVTSGANLNEDDEVEISITPAEGQVPTATINGSQIELTESGGVYTGNFAMPGQASSLVINTGSSGGDGGDDLDKD